VPVPINWRPGQRTLALLVAFLLGAPGQLLSGPSWNGKKCAVVLTYDDALEVHLDRVVPLLDSLGLRATFYIPCGFSDFQKRLHDWRWVAWKGHELGNHTMFHPCEGGRAGREWVRPEYDLASYSLGRFADEVAAANAFLEAVDGRKTRTFAYPCGDTLAGGVSVGGVVRRHFLAARGTAARIETLDSVDLYHIGVYLVNGQTGEELVRAVREATGKGGLLVFVFHGVGGGHSINVSAEAHRQLLSYLASQQKEIWIAPLVEVAHFVRERRGMAAGPVAR
jgi:peptidoglycan/xylan/chitin deacetylase (PgdA/CDA1 family)